MRTLLFLFTLLISFTTCIAQERDTTNLKSFTLVNIQLKDGTKIWGLIDQSSKSNYSITDFNLGKINVPVDKINEIDSIKISRNILIETQNNFTYIGNIISYNENEIIISNNSLDQISINLNSISKITLSDAYLNKNGKTWFSNPNATRYFFAPSAIPLNKKEGYFQNVYLLANSVSVGLTNNITIGGGVVIPVLFYVTPKISYKLAKNFYAGAGILYTQSFIKDFDLNASIGYGLVTIGNHEHNFTIGSGYGMAKFDKKYKATPMPIITINGMTRVSKRISIVTENWLIPRAGYNKEFESIDPVDGSVYYNSTYINQNFYTMAGSAGIRIMPGIKTSVDFSVVGIKASPQQDYLFLPYLDFVYKF